MIKIRLGRSRLRGQPDELARKVADKLLGAATAETIKLSRPRIRRLAAKIRAAANIEVEKLMPTIVSVMDRDLHGNWQRGSTLTYQDLMKGASLTTAFANMGYFERQLPQWAPLDPTYLAWKEKHTPANASRMFEASGEMVSFFEASGAAILRSRLGGVRVETRTPRGLRTGYFENEVNEEDVRRVKTYQEIIFGSITVSIFPNLAKAMLPALASGSGRWTDLGTGRGGEIENYIFEGNQEIVQKLVNKNHPYRPLLLPVIQFWMLVRVPNAIFGVLQEHIRRAKPRGEA